MIIKFSGFKQPPFRSHVVKKIGGKFQKILIGDTLDEDPKVCYELMADPDLIWVEVKKSPRSHIESAPAGENRAILDGKAE